MAILCTICARKGSKGVRNKNMKLLLGKPLIAYTLKQALSCKSIERTVVSTDSEEIAKLAKHLGAEVPFLRPASLATDTAPKLPVIQQAVKYYISELNYYPEYVIDLDPTSPLRQMQDIVKCINLLKSGACDSVITGYKSNKNPYFNMVELNDSGFARLSKKSIKRVARRQDAPSVYAMNASIYGWKTDFLLKTDNLFSGKVKFIEMPQERSIDIDSEFDFELVKFIMKKRGIK